MELEPLRYAHDEGQTDVCMSEDGQHYITCGSDGDVRIWSLDEIQDPTHNCVGEWATSLQQKGNQLFVATASNDIQILKYPEGERVGVLERFTASVNQIVTSKNHNFMAVATENMEVKVLNLIKTDEAITLTGLNGPCLSVALSFNCDLVAASSGDGKLRIWNIKSKELIKEIECFPKVNSFSNASVLCRIDFEPIGSTILAYPSENNIVLLNTNDWSQKLLSSDDISASYSLVKYSPCGKYIIGASNEGDFALFDSKSATVLSIGKHPNNTSISGLIWNHENSKLAYTDFEGQLGIIKSSLKKTEDDVHDVEFMNNQMLGVEDENSSDGKIIFVDDDDDEDNENAVSVEKLKKQYLPVDDLEPELKFDENSSPAPSPRVATEVPLQPAFMPSSTPDHLNPRYLCWNDTGIIKCYGSNIDDDAAKSIEVEFHDSTFHNSLMIQNYQDYHLGSLSKASLVVANSSQISVIPISASSNEWILKVDEPEEIVLVASSEKLVCFGLNNNLVRICSTFGTQIGVISNPGPLVSMNAYKNALLVAYHRSGVFKGNQCIGVKYITFDGFTCDCKELGSALSLEATLLWVGFSDVGTPAMLDSFGILSLYPLSCNLWIPYCNTLKSNNNVSDGFFVTSLFESNQTIAGIKCRGSLYPAFIPRPTACEIPLEPLFAETDTEKTQMESNLFTWSTLKIDNIEKKYKETALKTFVLACKNNLDYRAVEFMEILSNPQILTLGIKYASKLEKKRLAEKLIDLATKITDQDDIIEENSRMEVQQPVRKLSLNLSKFTPNKKPINDNPKQVPSSIMIEETQHNVLENTQDSSISTEESSFAERQPRNPFLKKQPTNIAVDVKNPLSLVDKFAGLEYQRNPTQNIKNNSSEKRKHPDFTENIKQKEKQRKLDIFKFSKKS